MRLTRSTGSAIGLGLVLSIAAAPAGAQTDTTRTDTTRTRQDTTGRTMQDTTRRTTQDTSTMTARSTRRIPVQKERDFSRSRFNDRRGVTTDTAMGEVMINQDSVRIDSLTSAAAMDRARIDSLEARANTLDRTVTSMNDSIRTVRTEITTVSTRTAALSDSVVQLNQRFERLRNGSVFNNSGFYVGVGTGANFTRGALNDIGYSEGLNVSIPIGFHRPGTALGFRGELGFQSFDGRANAPVFGGTQFSNPDPQILSAVGMLSLHFPFGSTGRSNFFFMGGGGAYNFRDIGTASALNDRLNDSNTGDNVTKLGVTGGAGLELHMLGAASFFVQSRFTNVFSDDGRITNTTGGNLQWIPLIAGITLR